MLKNVNVKSQKNILRIFDKLTVSLTEKNSILQIFLKSFKSRF